MFTIEKGVPFRSPATLHARMGNTIQSSALLISNHPGFVVAIAVESDGVRIWRLADAYATDSHDA